MIIVKLYFIFITTYFSNMSMSKFICSSSITGYLGVFQFFTPVKYTAMNDTMFTCANMLTFLTRFLTSQQCSSGQ